jgi:REP element-mobilizing transposase RayT
MYRFQHHSQFFTATNLNWLRILENDYHKQILLEALKHRVEKKEVTIYAFVIMPNHFHAIWQIHDGIEKENFQGNLLKFTARSILKFMKMNDDKLLEQLNVKTADRNYQVWERNALSIDLFTEEVFLQKLNYIHNNPVQSKWRLAELPEEYKFSSAKFYETGIDDFNFLTHFRE